MKNRIVAYLLPLSVLAFGCDSSEDVDGGVPDSGVRADATVRRDATVADSGPFPDAAGMDATGPDADGPDATPPDAEPMDASAPLPVTVRSYLDGQQPLPIAVIFHNPDGTVVSSTLAFGQVSEMLPPGSMVSLPATRFTGKGGPSASMYLVTDVQPGDIYDVSPVFGASDYLGDVEITLPGYFDKATYFYYVDYGCGAQYVEDPITLFVGNVYTDCTGSSTTTLSVVATVRDDSDVIVAYSVTDVVDLVPGGAATVTLPDWETALVSADLSLTSLSTSGVDLYSEHRLIRRGASYAAQYDYESLGSGGDYSGDLDTVPFGDGEARFIEVQPYRGGYSNRFERNAQTGPASLDFGADFLPIIQAPNVTTTNDEARPQLDWTLPGGVAADGAVLRLTAYDPYVTWLIVTPAGAGSVRLPELPTDYADLEPVTANGYETGSFLFEANLVPDYALFRTIVVPAFINRGVSEAIYRLGPVGLEARASGSDFAIFGQD